MLTQVFGCPVDTLKLTEGHFMLTGVGIMQYFTVGSLWNNMVKEFSVLPRAKLITNFHFISWLHIKKFYLYHSLLLDYRSNTVSQRLFYDVRCVFVWNPSKDQCWLEAYSRFEEKSKCIYPNPTPARKEATKLRKLLKKSSMFSLKPHPPIRTFEHRMWTEDNLGCYIKIVWP